MGGDTTRYSFDPLRHPAGVLFGQGRVLTDADLNELVELLDRRLRLETLDTEGRLIYSSYTPDAFTLGLTAGELTIAPGRAYVDGLQAECFGAAATRAFDLAVEGLAGVDPVPYDEQPYFSTGWPALPTSGTHLVYLDVWHREEDFVDDPRLVDPAIGFDTSTRLQTIWQVRVLADDQPGLTCGTPDDEVTGWPATTAPSGGRLTTGAVGVPSSDDPCVVPPSGGYRGVENRLYRVEVHAGGPLGTATFKWSRDNASIVVPCTGINSARDTVTVTRTGRDQTLRFSAGDWVEVTDERRRLAGLPGELRRVVLVDDVAQSVKLATPALSADLDPADPARLTRLVRWDQRGQVLDPTGTVVDDVEANGGFVNVPASGGPLVLEDGVEVQFSGTDFHVGDYWCFAARTADGSVEPLVAAPPRGIHHHYARLGVWTIGDVPQSCRPQPPVADDGCCDCTVCVTPESHVSGDLTLQAAIDALGPDGGRICVKPGLYVIERTLIIRGKLALTLVGEGVGTVILHRGPGPAALVFESGEVRVLDIVIAALGDPDKPDPDSGAPGYAVVRVAATVWCDLERCVVADLGALGDAIGSPRVAVSYDGLVVQAGVRDCVLAAALGVAGIPQITETREFAREAGYLVTADLAIERNVCLCSIAGVALGSFDSGRLISMHLLQTRIADNVVLGARVVGIGLTGAIDGGGGGGSSEEGGLLSRLLDTPARAAITGNLVSASIDGIVVSSSYTTVADNDVRCVSTGRDPDDRRGAGAAIHLVPGLDRLGVAAIVVRENRLNGGDAGVRISERGRDLRVDCNRIEGAVSAGVVVEDFVDVAALQITGNELIDVAVAVRAGDRLAGIRAVGCKDVRVADNIIVGTGAQVERGARVAAIEVVGCAGVQVTGNSALRVGPADAFNGEVFGIDIAAPFARVDVFDNEVRPPDQLERGRRSSFIALHIGDPVEPVGEVEIPIVPGRPQLVFTGLETLPVSLFLAAYKAGLIVLAAARLDDLRGPVFAVRGNRLEAVGIAPAALIKGRVLRGVTSDNHFTLVAPVARPALDITARTLVLDANIIDCVPQSRGSDAAVITLSGPITVLGNIASGPIDVNGMGGPGFPWDGLNA